ncbi:peptidoglycan-binding protein, partial [Pseudooceanicola lipolyticus]
MKSLIVSAVLILMVAMRPAVAQQAGQDVVWVQIEAHPSLRVAQDRARLYSGNLDDVNGFALGGNWYGIVLGPYTRTDAERVLQVYRSERQVPQDSFIAYTRNFGRQFWPVGADALNAAAVAAPLPGTQP